MEKATGSASSICDHTAISPLIFVWFVQRFFEHSDSFSDYLLDSVAHDLVDDAATLEHDVLGHVCGIQSAGLDNTR